MSNNDIVLGIKIKLDGREVDGQIRVLTGDVDQLSNAVKNQTNAAQTSAQQTSKQSDALRDLEQSAHDAASEVLSVGKSALDAAANISGIKRDIDGLRNSFLLFVGTAAVAGAQAARAIGFEAQFSDVRKVVDGSRAELKKLESDLKSLSTAISIPLDGLAQIAAQGGQLGLPIGELTQFTELVAKMSVGFNLLPDEAGNAIGTLRNIFQLTLPELEKFGDQINTVADNANTSERELLNLISRIGDTGQQFGLLRSETLGLSAAILSLGKPPEVAATALENMLTSLRNADLQTKDFQTALAAMGINAKKFAQDIDKNPKAALDRFLESLRALDGRSRSGVINQLFGRGQDAVVINQLVSSIGEYRRIVKLANQDEIFSGSLARTFEEREKTVSAAFQRLRNSISVFSINVAETFLPTIQFVADGLRDLAAGMADIAERFPNLTAFTRLAALILPLAGVFRLVSAAAGLIAPALGPAASALGSLLSVAAGSGILVTLHAGLTGISGILTALGSTVLGRLIIGVGAAAIAFSGLGTAILSVAANPIAVMVAGLSLVIIRIAGASSILGGLGAAVATLGRGLLTLVGGPLGATIAGLTFLGVKFLQVKDNAVEFGGVQTTVGGVIEAAWGVITDGIGSAASSIGGYLAGMGQALLDLVGVNDLTWSDIRAALAAALQDVATFTQNAVNMVIGGWTGLAQIIGAEFDNVIATARTKFQNIVNLANAVGRDVRAAFSGDFGVGNISSALAANAENNHRNDARASNARDAALKAAGQAISTDYVSLFVADFKLGIAEAGKRLEDTIAERIRAGAQKGSKSLRDEVRKTSGGRSLDGALGDTERAHKSAASAAERAAKAESGRRDEIAKTIAQIQQETALIGLSDKARQRSVELTHALTKAKGAEVDAIKSALQTKWDEIDADARRNAMREQSVKDAIALKDLQDAASDAQHLAALARELKAQGLNNDAIRDRLDLEKELASARKTYMSQEFDLDPQAIDKNITARKAAEKELAGIIDDNSKNSADFFEAAWKRAAENIQDSLASMFENLLNGDALNSFEDFFKNIQKSINRVFAEQLSTSIINMFKGSSASFTSGGSGSAAGGLFSGAADWIKGLFGFGSSATTPGLSSNTAFAGPPTQNVAAQGLGGLGNFFSQFFSTGQGGGFSFTGANGGGSGWSALGGLAKLIPGAGGYGLKGPQSDSSLKTYFGISNAITDMIGNFFPIAKLIAPLKNLLLNFGGKLFQNRRPTLSSYAIGAAANVLFPFLGPAGHLLATFLLGEKIPSPASFTRGAYSAGKLTLGRSGQVDGGDVKITRDFTRQFGDLVAGLSRSLNQSFGDFTSIFWHKFDVKGNTQTAGSLRDKGGTFYGANWSSDRDLQKLANEAALALVKHNIANQSDLHYRQAIRDSKGLKGLENRIGQIDQIGVAIGEYGEALSKLREINAQFDELTKKAEKYHFAAADVEAARQRAIDALKNDTLSAFRQLAGLGPTLAAQLGDLNNQMIALEANARTLKLAEGDLLGLRAKAIAAAREQYLSPLTDVSGSIVDQIAQLTGNLPAAEDVAPLYELLAASTDPTEQTRYINRIQRALTQRYNVEIAAINKVAGAVNGLKQFVDGLKLSNLSTLDPEQRLREAQGQYGTTLLKAQAGDQTALDSLANTAQAYLQEAQSFYASTPAYAAIFENVTETLSSLGAELGAGIDAESAAAEAANALTSSLQSLKDIIDSIVVSQSAAFDAAAGGLTGGPAAPAATFQDLTENQIAANIAALPANATKAARRAVNEQNRDLRAQINAWLFGGDDELAKTQSYQELTASIDETRATLKNVKKTDPQHGALQAQLDGLLAQRKALGKVKFREQGGWTQGPTIVGENGPELIDFARPTHVQNNQRTQAIIAGSNDNVVAELQKANAELQALVRLQAAQAQAMLERLDSIAGSMTAVERKTRLGAAA